MRIAARDLKPTVVVAPDTERPIRLRTGAITFQFTEAEAIGLATQLADAVDQNRINQQGAQHE
ncbi:hypothetical protein [Mycolicibacterium sp. NCC-Tsukiji]|uniref:hypothetical protein n=1 Tax=Mycolicibacterium sp. NCC-Tsukiji TaxID=2185272 RepID=UPI000ECCAE71|nr:hypothetical protein [Mycolicibacterium sp. NCC-Tsukiji]GCA97171.1 hypothetical protein NCCNTM_08060 [Mycolicibacterium sp. NCC-Tsukiji]